MFENIGKRIIKSLIEEIKCLSPTDLELVGHNIVSIIEDERMIHHGINKDYKPSGYTVDSFTDDSNVVAEYSTDKEYFLENGYTKIVKDINHAVDHKLPDGPKKIYLISNQEEPPSFRSKFNETKTAQNQGRRVIIYDARELAKLIYEQSIQNATYASFYKQFFIEFSMNIDNYEHYGKVPAQCEKHISDPVLIDKIKNHFVKGNNICILHGVSGSGKTQGAIDYIHQEGKKFANYIWITGDDWVDDSSLNSIQRTRGGSPINISGMFNSSKTLLVIDNIERCLNEAHLSELKEGFSKGSEVLATSQIAVPGSQIYLPIPLLNKEIALRILGENSNTVSETCNKVVETCRFSPLILSTIRNIVELEDVERETLYREVLEGPTEITGPDGLSIMRRILEKLDNKIIASLKKISNSGSSTHDLDFLKDFIGILSCNNLRKLSILTPTSTPKIVKVHDFISMSIRDNTSSYEIVEAIIKYIDKNNGEMTPSVIRQIHLCYKQIQEENTKRGQRNPDWLTYAILQIEGREKYDVYGQVYQKEMIPDLSLASVMCIIEARELHTYTIGDFNQRREHYKQCVEMYQKAFEEATQSEVKDELLHHQGKALRRDGRYNDALDAFIKLLKKKVSHATQGQIVHLGTLYNVESDIKEAGEKYTRILLEEMLDDASTVPLRVSLAAIARLRSYKSISREICEQSEKVKSLADIIAMSALEGFGQFYEAFLSFTSMFGYHHSECCINLVETFPEMLTMPQETVDKGEWVNACEALSNIAIAAKRMKKLEIADRVAKASIEFAKHISLDKRLKPYSARVVAKSYLTGNMPQEALEIIKEVKEGEMDHWLLYRKAEAQLGINDNKQALESAQAALKLAEEDKRNKDRIAIYYDLLSKCYEQLDDKTNAIIKLRIAEEKCKDFKYKKDIQQRIMTLEEGGKGE